MSVVKINVLEVPEGRGELLEERFAQRAGEVDKVDGFESFELLRPTEGTDKYLVVTRWRDDAAFRAWVESDAFQKGHARSGGGQEGASPHGAEGGHPHGGHGHAQGGHGHGGEAGHGGPGPAAVGSELWGFEIVTSAAREDATGT